MARTEKNITTRGLDKRRMKKLATCQWLHEHRAPHGTERDSEKAGGRARSRYARVEGSSARTLHLPRLVIELAIAGGDDRYRKLLAPLARLEAILLDDFGLAALTEEERRDLLESLEDRYERRCTVVTSQYPVEHWHDLIGDPTLAGEILDRLVHNAYRLDCILRMTAQATSARTRSGVPRVRRPLAIAFGVLS